MRNQTEPVNPFVYLDPEKLEILRVLVQQHINTVAEISVDIEVRTSSYTAVLEDLEADILEAWRGDAKRPEENAAGCAAEAVPSVAATGDESAVRKPGLQRVLRSGAGSEDSPSEVRRPSQRARRRKP